MIGLQELASNQIEDGRDRRGAEPSDKIAALGSIQDPRRIGKERLPPDQNIHDD